MSAFVVMHGENGEGGCIDAVFASRESALTFIAEGGVTPHFGPWRLVGDDEWESGCDWLAVYKYEVRP